MPWACAIAAVVIWGATYSSTRSLLGDFSALEIMVIRFVLAWVALIGLGWRNVGLVRFRHEVLFAVMGLLGVVICQLFENAAIYYTNASNVALFMSFGPVVTVLLSRIFLHDRFLSCGAVLGCFISIVGAAMMNGSDGEGFLFRPLGDVLAIGSMLGWGVYSVLLDKVDRLGYSQIVIVRKTFFWAIVILLILCTWGITDSGYCSFDGSFSVTLDRDANLERFSSLTNWMNLCFLGILASSVSFVLWNVACKGNGIARSSVILYLTPIVGVAFAALFLGERLPPMSVCGGILIIGGLVIANRRRK